jgi:hypothetical protein
MATVILLLGDLWQTVNCVEIMIAYHILSVTRRPPVGDSVSCVNKDNLNIVMVFWLIQGNVVGRMLYLLYMT